MPTRLIKKYKNRRLYDTHLSQYITVEDLQRYVIDGLSFQVEDSVSGKDMTNATLLQIFVEMEAGTHFLSADMLRQLILLAHHPMHQSLQAMMEQMTTFLENKLHANTIESDYQRASEAWNQQTQQFLQQWQDFFK